MKRDWTAYDSAKQSMYVRDKYRCRHCHASMDLTPHHMVYRSHGGLDETSNLIVLCVRCHTEVHDGRLKLAWGLLGADGAIQFERKRGY
jgi:5-methylcytosine-specific restriction endonuclease McrA